MDNHNEGVHAMGEGECITRNTDVKSWRSFSNSANNKAHSDLIKKNWFSKIWDVYILIMRYLNVKNQWNLK